METIKTYSIKGISDIQIKSRLSQVNIMESSSEEITLRWTDTKRRTTTAVQNGSSLVVEDKAPITLYGIVGLIQLKQDKELTLELPAGFGGSIRIESRDEAVRVLGVESNGSLSIKTTAGPIEISASKMQRYELTSMSGNILLQSIVSDKGIRADTDNGNIDCTCAESSEEYLLDCRSEHGSCNLPSEVHRGRKPLRLHTSTGAVKVQFI